MFWEAITHYWHEITAWGAVLDIFITIFFIGWVLTLKRDPTSALAWCLLVILLPLVGPVLFLIFGYQSVHRPLKRKQRHMTQFRLTHPRDRHLGEKAAAELTGPDHEWESMARLARRFDAMPMTSGNCVKLYSEDGQRAVEDMLEAIRSARHHVHLEFFIVQPDETGRRFIEALAERARQGVEVRLLYDAVGSHRLGWRFLKTMRDAGGRCAAFLPIAPLRRRFQVNLRNHRKILVVDGRVGFTGGLNIGDEYLSKNEHFGYWRDTHLRLEGPAVVDLQNVFIEDWDFAAGENLRGKEYFPSLPPAGDCAVQVIQSGPDQELKGIRQIYLAAIQRARRRLWIASPYFVPDAALLDAICLAGYQGVDVRFLGLYRPDKWLPYFAARYYWNSVVDAGVKVYQYSKGMMHAKVILVDGQWASVGSANLDNRSMHLNFELNCLLYTPKVVAELERAFCGDLECSILLEPQVYNRRPFTGRLVENACRLLSPIL